MTPLSSNPAVSAGVGGRVTAGKRTSPYSKLFLIALITAWLVSLTPMAELVKLAMSTGPSIVIGCLLGIAVLLLTRGIQWLYVLIYIVFLEQIFNMGASFIDEVVMVMLAFKIIARRGTSVRHRSGAYITGFIVVAVISALVNGVPAEVLLAGVRSYMQYAIVFLFIFRSRMTEEDFNRLLTTLIFAGVFFSIIGLANIYTGRVSTEGRSEGVLSNPNALAGYLVFVVPLLWFHWTEKGYSPLTKRLSLKWFGLIPFIAFVSTGSRSMIIGLAAGLLFVTFLKLGDFKQKVKLAALIILLMGISMALTEGRILERFTQVASKEYLDPDTNVRAYYTEQGWRLFFDNPIIGVGPGLYGGSVATIFESPVYAEYGIRSPNQWAGIVQSDIFYPHLAAELGTLGFVFYLLLVSRPILQWLLGIFAGSLIWTPLATSLAVSLVAILVASIGGPYLELHLTALFYWIFLAGLIIEIDRQKTAKIASASNMAVQTGPFGKLKRIRFR